MEPRRVRLGDVVDDYCPRERRVTDHAVVAMVGDEIRQTRCTACDAEHPYRAAQVPRRRKKDRDPAALFTAVAAGRAAGGLTRDAVRLSAEPGGWAPRDDGATVPAEPMPAPAADDPAARAGAPSAQAPEPSWPPPNVASPAASDDDEGRVRRSLIRATLPRPEGQPVTRPIPEFTMRQPGVRTGQGVGHRKGSRGGPTHSRPYGSSHGNVHPARHSAGRAHAPHRPDGAARGKKRSR